MAAITHLRPTFRLRRVIVAAAVAGSVVLPVSAADAAQESGSRWTAGVFPDGSVSLTGVTKPTADSTWVTGFRITQVGKGTRFDPVVYARDDRRNGPWRPVPTAPGATGRSNAIAATSATDALLVGDQEGTALGSGVMTQHWDGSSWTVVAAPTAPASTSGGLLSISAVSPTDVWAAGWTQIQDSATPDPDGGPTHIVDHSEGLVEHWDGRAWTRVPLPQPYPSWTLNSISASGPDDVWAVGSGFGADDKPLVLHYDGTAWDVLPTPPFGGLYGEFNAVTAKGPDDVWAVGRSVRDEDDPGHALVMHWNGRTWSTIATPAEAGPLYGVAPADAGVAAVGLTRDQEQGFALRAVPHRSWSLDLPASPPGGAGYLPWAVGVDRRTDRATIAGGMVDPATGVLMPMTLTGRV